MKNVPTTKNEYLTANTRHILSVFPDIMKPIMELDINLWCPLFDDNRYYFRNIFKIEGTGIQLNRCNWKFYKIEISPNNFLYCFTSIKGTSYEFDGEVTKENEELIQNFLKDLAEKIQQTKTI